MDMVEEAIQTERKRCLRLVSVTQPDISKIGGFQLQTMTADEWIKLAKQAICNAIANPPDQSTKAPTGSQDKPECVACYGTGVFQGAGMCHRCLGTGKGPSKQE